MSMEVFFMQGGGGYFFCMHKGGCNFFCGWQTFIDTPPPPPNIKRRLFLKKKIFGRKHVQLGYTCNTCVEFLDLLEA